MTLFPLHANERHPIGLFPLKSGEAIEGGQVGEVVNDGGTPELPEVEIFSDSTTGTKQLSLVGLLDDSSSGLGGGAAVFGTPITAGVTESTGTPAGPATHFASGKATIWLDPGMYATDVFDSGLGDLTGISPGEPLYASIAEPGLLVDLANEATAKDELGRFIRRFEGGFDAVDDFDSFFLPRVQPKLDGTVFMVLKFK